MRVSTPFDALTERVIGLAYKVHSELRAGYFEKVYENALCMEMDECGVKYERQKKMLVYYRDRIVGEFVADLVVEGTLLVELKALYEGYNESHKAQTINYLTGLKLPVGLLINFGKSVEVRRFLSKSLTSPPA